MKRFRAISLCILLTLVSVGSVLAETVDITYVGNTGFVIEAGGKKMVVDAMFDEGWDTYLVPSIPVRDDMKNARKPFNKVDLILVTHWHDDHFDVDIVAEHLRRNDKAVLVAPQQVVDLLKSHESYDKFSSRVLAATPGFGETIEVAVEGVAVSAIGMRHVPYPEGNVDRHREVENNGYIVRLGDVTVFHVGDGYLDVGSAFLSASRLGQRNIDVVFIEYFDRTPESIRVVNEVVRPKAVIPTHIPPKEWEIQAGEFRRVFPGAVVFRESMERKTVDLRGQPANNPNR
jgi:L-ascorbate metabolism protein UlaG (beta-lactamase superfamily)